MSLNLVYLIAALNWFSFGLGALFVPGRLMAASNAGNEFLMRRFGAYILLFALLAWMARGLADGDARNLLSLVFFLAYAATAIFTIWGVRNGQLASNDIYFSLIDIALAIGFGYYRFFSPE
jgi:hypothetical protein